MFKTDPIQSIIDSFGRLDQNLNSLMSGLFHFMADPTPRLLNGNAFFSTYTPLLKHVLHILLVVFFSLKMGNK